MSFLHIDLLHLLQSLGYIGIASIVFAESGLFFGFFFPGDSLLFTAGLLASQGFFSIYVLLPLVIISAILGDSVGYWFGYKIGPKIFTKENSFFFQKKHILRAKAFDEKYGAKALVLARFIPVVRTFVPIIVGVGKMKYSTFIKYNIIGGVLWGVVLTSLGYFLGTSVPNIDSYVYPIIIGIILLSFLPVAVELIKTKNNK
jgi:membrane-associated protein